MVKHQSNNKGFTLIEMLVAVAAFSVIIVSIGGIYSAVLRAHRAIISVQSAQEPARYLLESMAKEIRMSTINSPTTISASGDSTLDITNPREENVIYSFANNALTRNGSNVSPSNVNITGSFFTTGILTSPQARVTVVMKIRSNNVPAQYQTEINLQTTVSARGY